MTEDTFSRCMFLFALCYYFVTFFCIVVCCGNVAVSVNNKNNYFACNYLVVNFAKTSYML